MLRDHTSSRRVIEMRKRSEDGQSLVEFAIVAPVFFLLIFAIFQFGWQMHAQNITYEAARAAVAAEIQANCQGGDTGLAAAQQVFKNSGISPNAIESVYPGSVCQTLTSTYGASSLQEVLVTVVAKAQDMAPVLGLPTFTGHITAEATLPLEIK